MTAMSTYSAQYDDDGSPNPVVLLRTDSLNKAVAATEADGGGNAYVRHVASGLQRYLFQDRTVWLDDHGAEHPQPSDAAAR